MTDREKLIELIAKAKYICAHDYSDHTEDEYIADMLMDNGVTVQKWIPVSERLPKYGERVLTTDGYAIFEAYLSISHKWMRNEGIWWAESAVTHWMPLPEPPKECE